MIGIRVDLRDFKRLSDDLEKMAKRAIPYAIRDTLNGSAFALQKGWRGEVKRTFTLRNRYTEQSIRVDKAQGTSIAGMKAVTGTIAPFMPDQEEGGTVRGRGAHKAIPSAAAAGGALGAKRKSVVRSGFRLSSIQVTQRPLPKYGRRRQNAVAMAIAIRKGERFALLNRIKSKGRAIFEVKGGKRSGRARLIWDVSRGSVKVPREPTLQRSIALSSRVFEKVQYEAMLTQLRRNKVMGY